MIKKNNTHFHSNFYHKNHVLEINEIASHIFRLRFENQDLARRALPGQFINIKINETNFPFWRRPFSIHRINSDEGWVEILFRIVGMGTKLLSEKKKGDILNLIGPLGNSFQIDNKNIRSAMLIAGGLGIAPLLFLCDSLKKLNIDNYLFYGTKTENEFCCLREFEQLDTKIHLATEDGSTGHKGFITDLLGLKISELPSYRHLAIYACGPNPMLNRINLLANKLSILCQVSLETLMGCGIGACLGCGITAAQQKKNYVYVCKDGPVFYSKEILLSD